mmetsp:Transcript_41844/g.100856  ORF Transcript_41844/g.100856 Transcript_41844/m.100856 type:complete len:102 (-) Transcript_41844:794-1099(-)
MPETMDSGCKNKEKNDYHENDVICWSMTRPENSWSKNSGHETDGRTFRREGKRPTSTSFQCLSQPMLHRRAGSNLREYWLPAIKDCDSMKLNLGMQILHTA